MEVSDIPVGGATYAVDAADGWRLVVTRTTSPSAVRRGAVLLLHAMMADARSLDRPAGQGLASTLARAGWEVHAADLRGHGASGPTAAQGGRWTYDDLVLRDLPALAAAVRARVDGPVVVGGHSLGGHIALAAVGCGAIDVDGVVLFAANVWSHALEPDPLARLAKALVFRVFGAAARLPGGVPARRLGLGPADEAPDYVADLVRFWKDDAWCSRDGRHDWGAALSAIQLPVLSVLGLGDRLMARPSAAASWARQVPGAEVWLVGDGAHGMVGQPGHMALVVDPDAAGLHARVAGWLDRRVGMRGLTSQGGTVRS